MTYYYQTSRILLLFKTLDTVGGGLHIQSCRGAVLRSTIRITKNENLLNYYRNRYLSVVLSAVLGLL